MNSDKMLLATFLSTVFYSATYPYIHKEVMLCVSDYTIALNQIINCLGIILIGSLWNKYSDVLFKKYVVFCILETVVGIITTVYALTSKNVAIYYILDTFIFAVITRNIICGGNRLRSERYKQDAEREQFDNNNASASAIATIIGSLIAMILDLDFGMMLCIATFGNALDNILHIKIYFEQQKGESK